MKHVISMTCLNALFLFEVKILLVLIKWSYSPLQPSIMLIDEPRMVIAFSTLDSIFFRYVSFWVPLLELDLITYHSKIGVRLR